jgi:RimJ/RimL family protein N-acetyltransferase
MAGRSLTDGVITLRRWREEDAQTVVDCLDADPEITRWLDRIPQPYTLENALAYVRGETPAAGGDTFAITDAATGSVLGSIGASPPDDGGREVGYWLRADARGRGLATRALALIAAWSFEHHGLARVQLRVDPENLASCRVAERAGFTREGILRQAHWNPRIGGRRDWAVYSLLRDER